MCNKECNGNSSLPSPNAPATGNGAPCEATTATDLEPTAQKPAGNPQNAKTSVTGKGHFCERCGHEILHGEKYCSACGMVAGAWGSYCNLWKKYAVFSGRASRSEWAFAWLWSWILGNCLSVLVWALFWLMGGDIGNIDTSLVVDTSMLVYGLVMLLPWLALNCRRLHDVGKSGWDQLAVVTPGILIFVAVFRGWHVILVAFFSFLLLSGILVLSYWFFQPTKMIPTPKNAQTTV